MLGRQRFLRNATSNTDMSFRARCVACLRSIFSYLRSFSWLYAAKNVCFLPTFRDSLSDPYSRVTHRWETTILRYVETQNGADLIFTAAEAWNYAKQVLHGCTSVFCVNVGSGACCTITLGLQFNWSVKMCFADRLYEVDTCIQSIDEVCHCSSCICFCWIWSRFW